MRHVSVILMILVVLVSQGSVLTPDAQVSADFEARRSVMHDVSVYDLFSSHELSEDQRAAMEFLYAYMPLPDLAAYPAEFFLTNVDVSLCAAREMPWGRSVPEREFRHFVLPVRVNNENLDMSRPVFYEELKERVQGLTMSEAILEVNHWCHEKVTYQPSDARTSSPLSTVSQAIGRCGEESTFTVAALRSVGIPARQVYTPRWAHTDDNHAWVEAWADGQWHFIGACEPEPILDLAWFNSPASRGMLMNTNVFGAYNGPEEKLLQLPIQTTINVTANYAPIDTLDVKVVYTDGSPASDVTVDFMLYNYAEFYPVASKQTDSSGYASLAAGLGDMVVWATDGTLFGFAKGSPADDGTLCVVLDKDPVYAGTFAMDLIPPPSSASLPEATPEQRAENIRRSVYEDSLRRSYVATFYTPDMARLLADSLHTDPDATIRILVESRGNGRNISGFLSEIPAADRQRALKLLLAMSEKDRRDVSVDVLTDHLYNTQLPDSPLALDYVLNPRIENEGLTPYKEFFQTEIPVERQSAYRADPSEWALWVASNIEPDTDYNPSRLCMDPRAVWRQRKGDSRSRNIMFVAGARAMGIPARIDPVTGKTQYAGSDSQWTDVYFGSGAVSAVARTGVLDMTYTPVVHMDNPKYYYHYSISRISGGRPHLLEFEEYSDAISMAQHKPELEEGRYMLLSGQRMADGSVLVSGRFFVVEAGDTVTVPLEIRQDTAGVQVIGSLNAENIYHDFATGTDKSILSTTGRGYYVLGLINPNHEPSAHALNDIASLKDEFEQWGKSVVLLFSDATSLERFDFSAYRNLPSTAVFGIDSNGSSATDIITSLNLASSEYPVFVIADTFNRVVFVSQGYTIGLGDSLMKIIRQLKE